MKKVIKTQKAFAVVTKDTRELLMFGDAEIDSYATFFSKEDAETFKNEQGENTVILRCSISYETLIP